MSLLLDIISWLLILSGAFFALTAAVGLIRLPEFFSRTHSAGILDTLGAGLMLLGFGLQSGFSLVTVKLALVLGFILCLVWAHRGAPDVAMTEAAVGAGITTVLFLTVISRVGRREK